MDMKLIEISKRSIPLIFKLKYHENNVHLMMTQSKLE